MSPTLTDAKAAASDPTDGLAVLEAAAAGVPGVASDIPAHRESTAFVPATPPPITTTLPGGMPVDGMAAHAAGGVPATDGAAGDATNG